MNRPVSHLFAPMLAALMLLLSTMAPARAAADPATAASKPAKPAKASITTRSAAAPARCMFPDYKRQKAPAWVCGHSVDGFALSAVGVASKSKGGVRHVKEMATANARLKLARQIDERIEQRVNRHATANGISLAQAGRIISSTFEKKTQEVLVGSRIVESITSKRGTIYVLVGLNAQQARDSVIATVKAGIAAEPTPWKPLLAGTTADQLAAQLASD